MTRHYSNKPCAIASQNPPHPTGSWQVLLHQAFASAKIQRNRHGFTGLWSAHRFIYDSLENAGIENNSPFSWYRLFRIWLMSRGDADRLRSLCMQCVMQLQHPARFFRPTRTPVIMTLALLTLSVLLLPKAANTYREPAPQSSILRLVTLPWNDLEIDSPSLPLTRDDRLAIPIRAIPDTPGAVHDRAWIRSRNDHSYALQILSVSSEQSALHFCRQHSVCEQSAVYRSNVQSGNRVRVIYGVYPDYQAAKIALKSLPTGLRDAWIKSFARIKKEL